MWVLHRVMLLLLLVATSVVVGVMEVLMLRKVFVIVTAPLAVDVLPTTPKDVWAIGKVDPHVSLELRARVKAFATGIGKKTRIRALATVNAFVATQVARRIKALQAAMVVTRIRFRVRNLMRVTTMAACSALIRRAT